MSLSSPCPYPNGYNFANPSVTGEKGHNMSKKAIAIRNAAIKAIADGIMSFTEAQAYCAKFGIAL